LKKKGSEKMGKKELKRWLGNGISFPEKKRFLGSLPRKGKATPVLLRKIEFKKEPGSSGAEVSAWRSKGGGVVVVGTQVKVGKKKTQQTVKNESFRGRDTWTTDRLWKRK